MPVSVSVEYPDQNDIELDAYFLEIGSGHISVKGRGNRIRVSRPLTAGGTHLTVENGGTIMVDEGCCLGNLFAYALVGNATIHVGAETSFNGTTYITAHEPATVTIGMNCLFAHECSVTTSDVHRIFDIATGDRINPAGDITIGDRVWFSARAVIFGNSSIGTDSVVGWGSVVKGNFGSNLVIAGAPARIVRTGIRWEP